MARADRSASEYSARSPAALSPRCDRDARARGHELRGDGRGHGRLERHDHEPALSCEKEAAERAARLLRAGARNLQTRLKRSIDELVARFLQVQNLRITHVGLGFVARDLADL